MKFKITDPLVKICEKMTKDELTQVEERLVHYTKEYKKHSLNADIPSVVYSFYKFMDTKIASKIDGYLPNKISCKKGCSFCCEIHVNISKHEATLLHKLINEDKLEIDYEKVERQSKKNYKTWRELDPEDRKCVFLKNNECSIYDYRPGVCRKYMVVSEPLDCNVNNGTKQVAILASAEAEILQSIIISESEPKGMAEWLHFNNNHNPVNQIPLPPSTLVPETFHVR